MVCHLFLQELLQLCPPLRYERYACVFFTCPHSLQWEGKSISIWNDVQRCWFPTATPPISGFLVLTGPFSCSSSQIRCALLPAPNKRNYLLPKMKTPKTSYVQIKLLQLSNFKKDTLGHTLANCVKGKSARSMQFTGKLSFLYLRRLTDSESPANHISFHPNWLTCIHFVWRQTE